MKQILFLLLFPCLAMAQYTGNAGQKITLGEQTTADGLVWRGRLADTANLLTNKLDTSVYIVLDTGTRAMWYYRASTTPKWTRLVDSLNNLQGQLSLTAKVTGVLPVANGGTGADMSSLPNNYLIRTNSSGIFDTANVYEANGNIGLNVIPSSWGSQFKAIESGDNNNQSAVTFNTGANGLNFFANAFFDGSNTKYKYNGFATRFVTADGKYEYYNTSSGTAGNNITWTEVMTIDASGNLGINQPAPTQKLHVVGNARITAVGAGTFANNLNITSDGTLTTATSDEKYKYNILPISYGLNTILQLKPVNFQWIEGEENDLGFIAQDVADIIPEAVNTNWNSDLLMRYESIIPILTKAIQEQQVLIKALEQRILILENK
jgi:hypothetical protein